MKIVVYSKVKNKENVWKYSRVKRLQRRKTHYCAGLLSCSTLISVPVLFSLSKHNPLDFFLFCILNTLEFGAFGWRLKSPFLSVARELVRSSALWTAPDFCCSAAERECAYTQTGCHKIPVRKNMNGTDIFHYTWFTAVSPPSRDFQLT